ncbi:transmembrane protein 132A [Protopterus annectens]|uniref:transmembrane protein 132A n=1 Tax=Protopterus annectens TaxID=7888 RepID=UPI001CFB10DC|nr:transmembrane protein 132A [Protopterus annectens]
MKKKVACGPGSLWLEPGIDWLSWMFVFFTGILRVTCIEASVNPDLTIPPLLFPVYFPANVEILNSPHFYHVKQLQQDLLLNASLKTRTEAFMVYRPSVVPVIQASFPPFLVKQDLPADLVTPGRALISPDDEIFTRHVQIFIVEETVSPARPWIRVLFHLTGLGHSTDGSLPCVHLHAVCETKEVRNSCRIQSDLRACLAEVLIPLSWFGAPDAAAEHQSNTIKLYYTLDPPDLHGNCNQNKDWKKSDSGWRWHESESPGAKMIYIGAVVMKLTEALPVEELRLDRSILARLPHKTFRPGEIFTGSLTVATNFSSDLLTLRLKLKKGLNVLSAQSSDPDRWKVKLERSHGSKHHVAVITCRQLMVQKEWRGTGDFYELLKLEFETENITRAAVTRRISWQVEYPGRDPLLDTDKVISEIVTVQNDILNIFPLAMETEIINTAILTGKPINVPVRVVAVEDTGQLMDLSGSTGCRSNNQEALKVSEGCDYVFVSGKESHGGEDITVEFTYEHLSALLHLTVWVPRLPLRMEISDTTLSQVKGWKARTHSEKRYCSHVLLELLLLLSQRTRDHCVGKMIGQDCCLAHYSVEAVAVIWGGWSLSGPQTDVNDSSDYDDDGGQSELAHIFYLVRLGLLHPQANPTGTVHAHNVKEIKEWLQVKYSFKTKMNFDKQYATGGSYRSKLDDLYKMMYKYRTYMIENEYLNECILREIVPKGLRVYKFPNNVQYDSDFYKELVEIFNKCGLDMLRLMIKENVRCQELLQKEIDQIDQQIKSDLIFSIEEKNAKYFGLREDIDKKCNELVNRKMNKMERDIRDYDSKTCYPKPRFQYNKYNGYNKVTSFDVNENNRNDNIGCDNCQDYEREYPPLRIIDLFSSIPYKEGMELLEEIVYEDTKLTQNEKLVLSPVSKSILAEQTVIVTEEKVTLTELQVQLVSGISLSLRPSHGQDRVFLASTTAQETLHMPKQEAALSVWLAFSDHTMSPLQLYSQSDYILTVLPEDQEMISIHQDPANPNPIVVVKQEGYRIPLRLEMEAVVACQRHKRRSVLAAGRMSVSVRFNSTRGVGTKKQSNDGVDTGQSGHDRADTGQHNHRHKGSKQKSQGQGSMGGTASHTEHPVGREESSIKGASKTRVNIFDGNHIGEEDWLLSRKRQNSENTSPDSEAPRTRQHVPSYDGKFPVETSRPYDDGFSKSNYPVLDYYDTEFDDDEEEELVKTPKSHTELEIGLYVLLGVFCLAILVFLVNCVMFILRYQHKQIPSEAVDIGRPPQNWVWQGNENDAAGRQVELLFQSSDRVSATSPDACSPGHASANLENGRECSTGDAGLSIVATTGSPELTEKPAETSCSTVTDSTLSCSANGIISKCSQDATSAISLQHEDKDSPPYPTIPLSFQSEAKPHDTIGIQNRQWTYGPSQSTLKRLPGNGCGQREGNHSIPKGFLQDTMGHSEGIAGTFERIKLGEDFQTVRRKRVHFTTFLPSPPSDTPPAAQPDTHSILVASEEDIKWVCEDMGLKDPEELRSYMEKIRESA